MAKKTSSKSAASATASGSSHAKTPSVPSNTVHVASSTPAIKKPSISSNDHIGKVLLKVFNDYFDTAPGRVRLIDAFMAFLVALGVFQFGICIIIGTYVSISSLLLYHILLIDVFATLFLISASASLDFFFC